MDGMVTTDTEAIPVAGNNPDTQFRPCCLKSRGDGCCTTMDGMRTIGIHIIGESAATTNSGNNHNIFPGYAKCWQHLLNLGQDGIISTAGTPPDFLVS